jgi:hypothetical protein
MIDVAPGGASDGVRSGLDERSDALDDTPVDAAAADHTLELSTAELLHAQSELSISAPDEVGPTVIGIPIRNQLAAARIAHALSDAREAQALIDEAVELLATVRGLHAETYRLGAARGGLRDTIDLLAQWGPASGGDVESPAPAVDLKTDPSYEEIAIWLSFGIPVTS